MILVFVRRFQGLEGVFEGICLTVTGFEPSLFPLHVGQREGEGIAGVGRERQCYELAPVRRHVVAQIHGPPEFGAVQGSRRRRRGRGRSVRAGVAIMCVVLFFLVEASQLFLLYQVASQCIMLVVPSRCDETGAVRFNPPNPPDPPKPRRIIITRKPKALSHFDEAGIMRVSTPLSECLGAATGGFHAGARRGTSLFACAGLRRSAGGQRVWGGGSVFFCGGGEEGEEWGRMGWLIPSVLADTIYPAAQARKGELGPWALSLRLSYPFQGVWAVGLPRILCFCILYTRIYFTKRRGERRGGEAKMIVVMSPAKTLNMGAVTGFPLTTPHFTV